MRYIQFDSDAAAEIGEVGARVQLKDSNKLIRDYLDIIKRNLLSPIVVVIFLLAQRLLVLCCEVS